MSPWPEVSPSRRGCRSVRELYRTVVDKHSRIDIVCSNAGVVPNCPLDEMTDEKWEAMFNIRTEVLANGQQGGTTHKMAKGFVMPILCGRSKLLVYLHLLTSLSGNSSLG